jgi:hypothetical protein
MSELHRAEGELPCVTCGKGQLVLFGQYRGDPLNYVPAGAKRNMLGGILTKCITPVDLWVCNACGYIAFFATSTSGRV